jgi:hypothetical protein
VLLALFAAGYTQKLKPHEENTLGAPGYPNGKGDGAVGTFIVNRTVTHYLDATTEDHSIKVKAFYKQHLRAIKIIWDGNTKYFQSVPQSRNLRMEGIGPYGHKVRITCKPLAKRQTSIRIVSWPK